MRNTVKVLGIIVLTAVIGFSFAALSLTSCGGDDDSGGDTPPKIPSEYKNTTWSHTNGSKLELKTDTVTVTAPDGTTKTYTLDKIVDDSGTLLTFKTTQSESAVIMVKNGVIQSAQFSFLPTGSGFGWTKGSSSGSDPGSGSGKEETFTSIAAMAAWLKDQPDNTATTPYRIALNVSSLGGSSYDTTSVSATGYELRNSGKYVNLNLSGSTITSIGEKAFYNCTSLTSITIPNSVTNINPEAFSWCTSLINITFQGTITSDNLSDKAFGYNDRNIGHGYIGDLRNKYLAGGIGTYNRSGSGSTTSPYTWTKQ